MSHELQPLSPHPDDPSAKPLSTHAFLARVTDVNNQLAGLTVAVSHISSLHASILHSPNPSPQSHSELDGALTTTHSHISQIRNELKALHHDLALTTAWARSAAHAHEQDPSAAPIKTSHLARLRSEFKTKLAAFQDAEARYRQSHRDQLARQYRIVSPEATDAEIDEYASGAAPDANVFATAVMQGSRQNQAQSALEAVRQRHADLELIERTMMELANIMNDIDTMVAQQDEVVMHVEEVAESVEQDLEGGTKELAQAEGWATKLRKHKWICLGISITILLAIVLIIVLAVVLTPKPQVQ
jgi:syntaxin 1B/2/3